MSRAKLRVSPANLTAAIVGQPLDGDRQGIDQPEARLDGSEHQITNVLTADPTCGSEEAHGLAITAIEREGNPHPLSDVEPISKPSEHQRRLRASVGSRRFAARR